MESQCPATREELYHVQMDIKHVQAVQINHSDRLMRLEKRQADDAALKSVWGTGSPFPGVLSGTPQQGPVQNPSTDVFDDFDDEQGHNLLGNLQLEADGEPVRRGASRANSVRFDVSALQGSNWAQSSRNSGDFGPTRPSSGFGSHPMIERSLSHKSDGRHSSAGHSVHSIHSAPSGRTSSLGLDTNFIIGAQGDNSPLDVPDPPPGLFILGSVPSIIRCWLTSNFSHSALLYAVVCTGSQRSVLDYSLARELGLLDEVRKDSGRYTIRLPVYLPEAIITQPISRSSSPAPQLPALTADFEIVGLTQRSNPDRKKGIRVFLGSDTLRAHNADIMFSQNIMNLYGDDRNKLSVPFVRPEDENLFKNLYTSTISPEKNELKATAASFTPTDSKTKNEPTSDAVNGPLTAVIGREDQLKSPEHDQRSIEPQYPFTITPTSDINSLDRALEAKAGDLDNTLDSARHHTADGNASGTEASEAASSSDPTRRESISGIWGSWRTSNGSENGRDSESSSGYQRPTRGRNMKVLKSSKSISTSTAQNRSSSRTGTAYEPAPSRPSGETRRKSQAGGIENVPLRWEPKRVGSGSSDDPKGPKLIATIPRSMNPVGGASAFAWMNSNKTKTSATAE